MGFLDDYIYYRFEVFLTHEWGLEKSDKEMFDKYETVKYFLKRKQQYRIWDAETDIDHDRPHLIPYKTVAALKCSRQVLVLLTKSILEKSVDLQANQTKELNYSTLIPEPVHYAFFEDELADIGFYEKYPTMKKKFEEQGKDFQLLDLRDLSEENMNAKFKKLYANVKKHIADNPDD